MKKDGKIKARFKTAGKKITKRINPRAWLGYDYLKSSAMAIRDEAKKFFIPPPPGAKEDFHEVVEKLALSSEALQQKENALLRLVILFVFLMCFALVYSIYQLFHAYYLAFFPSFVLAFVCLALAFRYHFWYFQIRTQKLGCTFQDWFAYILKKDTGKNLTRKQ